MIRVPAPEEPIGFDDACRRRGKTWLVSHPDGDPHGYPIWKEWLPQLREAFESRCGFLGMYIPFGSVDHWMSTCSHRALAYEWSNYRFVEGCINSAKKPAWAGMLIDPFEVQDGWFEILLPSLQLVIAQIDDPWIRERAEFTLEKLHLRDGEAVIRHRKGWLDMYETGELALGGLRRVAPLLARAVEKRDENLAI